MSNQPPPVVITAARRTPIGGFLGALQTVPAPELGAAAMRAALARSKLDGDAVDEVLMGCVLPAGLGNAPARQAAMRAGVALSAGATTINKMCGSGLQAAILAHDAIAAGRARIAVAGGMENMSRAPHLHTRARGGVRLGHAQIYDHMLLDGLQEVTLDGKLMGDLAEDCAAKYQFTRAQQDAFATESLARANNAIANGWFADEITPVRVADRRGESYEITADEQPAQAKPDKIPHLKPVFRKDGTITPANASSISDGGAAMVLMPQAEAARRGCKSIARIVGHNSYAHEPQWFTTAPVGCIAGLLKKINWRAEEVDLWEINEAFAVVTLAVISEFNLPHEKVNIHGGACALGHPIGASGARIVATLLSALQRYNKKRGIAALCIGGGESVAMAVEMLA